MSTAIIAIKEYLATCDPPRDQSVDVAIFFAQSMSRELRSTLDQWEAAARALETLKAQQLHADEN